MYFVLFNKQLKQYVEHTCNNTCDIKNNSNDNVICTMFLMENNFFLSLSHMALSRQQECDRLQRRE